MSCTYLVVEVKVCQRQLHGFPNLLLLHVEATDIRVGDVGLLVDAQHSDARVCFGREYVNQSV
jgi:hypothetical protein